MKNHVFFKPSNIKFLAIVFTVLNILDVYSTYAGILFDGSTVGEANPVAKWIFDNIHFFNLITTMMAFKLSGILLIIVLCEALEVEKKWLGNAMLLVGCVFFSWVVCHNVCELNKSHIIQTLMLP